ncbi:hypothetical protein N7444_001458 [Penicillium canescens]|nr:hypothetical protein N7444_001458 [Penicillium canescens]
MSTSATIISTSAIQHPGPSVRLREEYARLKSLFTIGPTMLKQITKRFVHELHIAYESHLGNGPSDWKREGVFLTMDMGGTNFRVCKVELLGSGKYTTTQMDAKIPETIKSGTAQQLWLFIIQCLRKFVDYHEIPTDELQKIPLAFTFSYPVTQTSVTNGILQRWTKGFDISGVEGHDVAAELQRALYENAIALVNDTTGTLMASSYVDKDT